MDEKMYSVQGMHCASCELLIEKRVLEEPAVRAVDASVGNGTLRVEYDGQPPRIKDLNKWFKSDGYTFFDNGHSTERRPLIYVQEGKGIQVDRSILRQKLGTLAKIGLVFFLLSLIEKTGAAAYVSVSDTSALGIFFLFGLVAGLSSCAALVGGLLLSLMKKWNTEHGYDAGLRTKLKPQLSFHLGRVIAYTVLGAVLGALGQAVAFENVTIYALITVVVSVVMLVIGLQMAGVRWAERIQIRLPKFVTRRSGAGDSGKGFPFLIGAGTVLLPCGFTIIAEGIALTAGTAARGALIMLMFVVGTMLPLLLIGVVGAQGSKNPKRNRAFSFYTGIVLVIFALYNVNGQLNVLGWPSVSDVLAKSEAPRDNTPARVPVGREQAVNLLAEGFSYTLTSASTIQAGVPTKMVVDNRGVLGCGAYMASRGLINGFVSLKPGQNIIDLGTPKPGTYKITCSMGMVPPVVLRVQ